MFHQYALQFFPTLPHTNYDENPNLQ